MHEAIYGHHFCISIHTLAWRVTIRRRCRAAVAVISIHTLAWRVTISAMSIHIQTRYFNPHPRVEGDVMACPIVVGILDFNPHPRVEGDSYIWYILLRNAAYIESDTTLSS